MEDRYAIPYTWALKPQDREWRRKNGLWHLAQTYGPSLEGKVVLDAGCGDGWYASRILKTGAKQVLGVDYSERAVAFAQLILPDAKFYASSITELPFADGSVDSIYCFQVLEHLPPETLKQAVSEFSRVLARHGSLVVSVPSTVRLKSPAHFQHFTPDSITAALDSHFQVERLIGQEKRTFLLERLERLCKNSLWSLPRLASTINQGLFLQRWNETSPAEGQNIVAICSKLS